MVPSQLNLTNMRISKIAQFPNSFCRPRPTRPSPCLGFSPGGLHEDLGILPDLAPRVEARDRALAVVRGGFTTAGTGDGGACRII